MIEPFDGSGLRNLRDRQAKYQRAKGTKHKSKADVARQAALMNFVLRFYHAATRSMASASKAPKCRNRYASDSLKNLRSAR